MNAFITNVIDTIRPSTSNLIARGKKIYIIVSSRVGSAVPCGLPRESYFTIYLSTDVVCFTIGVYLDCRYSKILNIPLLGKNVITSS